MLVLDGSGSMSAADFPEGAPNRMDRVRVALARVVPDVARVRRMGLVVYGPGKSENSCSNVEVRLPPTPNAAREILRIAEGVRPAGRTALTRSVERAIEVLKDSPRPVEIVVLTDGEDTCGGDPCRLARRTRADAAGITIHVVGFRLPSHSETSGARCLADGTGGKFVLAETTAELTDALRQTLMCPEMSQDPVAVRRSVALGERRHRSAPTQSAAAIDPCLKTRTGQAAAGACRFPQPPPK